MHQDGVCADAAGRAFRQRHGWRLLEGLRVPQSAAVVAAVLGRLAVLNALHARKLRVRRAVLGAVRYQPHLCPANELLVKHKGQTEEDVN